MESDTRRAFIVVSLCITALIALYAAGLDFIPVLDHANLVFHEAGHPILGLLGQTAGLYGGTIGQLGFPVAVAVTFWRRGELLGVALGAIWFFQNWLDIAPYMADARARELPLVGGGDHDWFNIFFRWNVLSSDTTIAAAVRFLGWAGIFSVWMWVGWLWLVGQSASAERAPSRRVR